MLASSRFDKQASVLAAASTVVTQASGWGGAWGKQKMRGITVLELLRITVLELLRLIPPASVGGGWAGLGGGGGAGASRKCGGITVLELLRLENAKTVIPPSRKCGGITVLEL